MVELDVCPIGIGRIAEPIRHHSFPAAGHGGLGQADGLRSATGGGGRLGGGPRASDTAAHRATRGARGRLEANSRRQRALGLLGVLCLGTTWEV